MSTLGDRLLVELKDTSDMADSEIDGTHSHSHSRSYSCSRSRSCSCSYFDF